MPSSGAARRAVLCVLTAVSAAPCAAEFHRLLEVNGHTVLEHFLVGLFALNVSWIALSFWTAVLGFLSLARTGGRPEGLVWPESPPPLVTRTAVLIPVHNEDPREVFSLLEAMWGSLEATGESAAFHFFVLSDTTNPALWLQEELEWASVCRRLGAQGRLFYRRRSSNEGKKSGNVAEFCRGWGSAYDFLVVLDADSLLDGETLVQMAHLMEANPRAGILQAPPRLFGRETLFARVQQFASSVYGTVSAAGLAFWQLGESNYWGHNAILRAGAFRNHCGLPLLPYRAPFGGEILSHDFVEAALMRRAGYEVWLLPELAGSYEQPPPTLLDYAKRDQRWCQGNLQHLALLGAGGLHPVSRVHFLMGALSYLASPLWLLLALVGIGSALHDQTLTPTYFPAHRTLFPEWPAFDVAAGWRLWAVSLVFLLGPKVLGVAWTFLTRPSFRRGLALTLGFLTEVVLGALLAPLHMAFHTVFVVTALAGHRVSWDSQQRKDRRTGWREAFVAHRAQWLLGAVVTGILVLARPSLLGPFAPLLAGLLLAVPLSVATSSSALGRALCRLGLLVGPEEQIPPEILRRLAQTRERAPAAKANAVVAEAIHRALIQARAGHEVRAGGAPPRETTRAAAGPAL
jgi:membrane glycosyltransferase